MAIPLIAMAADHEEPWPVTEWVDVTRPEGLQLETVFRDTARQLWGITTGSKSVRHGLQGALLKWDGEKRSWQQTPVVIAPRPDWDRRGAPPWIGWARPPVVILGNEGCLLAVVVSDAYQQAQKAIDGDPAPPKHGIRAHQDVDDNQSRHTGKNDSLYWLDAYLYRDGKWCEPKRLNELLTTERAFFVKHFNQQTPTPEFFDLQVSGKNLWWAEGTSVHVLDEVGKHATWTAPSNKKEKGGIFREPVGWLHAINLVLLPDGTLWYIDGLNVTALRLTQRGIEAETLPRDATACVSQGANVYVARNGRVWTYQKNPTEPEYFPSYLFRDGHWTREAVGAFLLEDNSGGLWFLPAIEELKNSSNRYNILKGDQCYHLDMPIPRGVYVGMVTPAGTDILLAVCGGYRVFAIERSRSKLGWAVRSVIGFNGFSDLVPMWLDGRDMNGSSAFAVWLDGHGNLVTSKGWSARLPEGKLP